MSSPAVQFRSRMPRIAEAAVERARLTVVPRRRVRAARVPFVTLVSLVLLLGVIGLLLFNTSMQQASFATTSLEDQASNLTAREQTLRMELDVLRNPQHVAEQAQKLGMCVPTSPAFLDLSTTKILGQVSSACAPVRLNPPAPAKPPVLNPAPTYVDPPADTSGLVPGASAAGGGRGDGTKNHTGHSNHTSN